MNGGFNRGLCHQKPQPDLTPTASPYPHAALIRSIREAVECASVRDQVAVATYSTVANAAVALAVQGLAVLKVRNGRVMPLSMSFIVNSARVTGKSTAFRTCFEPMATQDKAADAAYKKAEVEYPIKLRDWKKQRADVIDMISKKRLKGEAYGYLQAELDLLLQSMPVKPREQNWLITDTTPAAFLERIAGNNQSVGLACGEGVIPFKYLFEFFGHLNLAWDGDTITNSRKGTGTKVAHDVKVMTLILTQPDVFNDFRARHGDLALGMGAWARFLLVRPPKIKGPITSDLDPEKLVEALDAFIARLAELIVERERRVNAGITDPDIVELSSDANDCLTKFHEEMKARVNDGSLSDVSDFALRAAEHAARLAATYSYFDGEHKVKLDTMERAITIIRHHLLEYVNCFSLKATAPDVELDAEAMEVHLQKKFWIRGRTSVSMSHLEGYGPSKELRKMGRLLPALKYLQSQGKIDLTPQGRTFYVKYLPSPKRQA